MILPSVEQFKRKYDTSRKISGDRLRVGNDSSYLSLPEHVLDEATAYEFTNNNSQSTLDLLQHGFRGISEDEWGD